MNERDAQRPLAEEDAERWEALVGAIVAEAAPELARRREERNVLAILGDWQWPGLPLATVAAAMLLAGIVLLDSEELTAAPSDGTLVEALVPTPLAAWAVDDYEMEPHELVAALGEVSR